MSWGFSGGVKGVSVALSQFSEVSLGLKDRSMVVLSTGLKRCGESLKILEEKILQQILRREVFAKLKLLLRM